MDAKHRVVILGGGFGGLYAAKALKNAPAQVTLLDRRNFHLFQPLLYQVATGSLAPGEIASPLRAVVRKQQNTQVLLGEALDIDTEQRKVILDSGELNYDTLIVATGSGDYYFGHDEWHLAAPGLKSIEEATQIRHKILYAFEAAEKEHDPQKRSEWLTFVLVRAGATLDRGGRVVVGPDCSVPGHPEIFVIGDLGHFEENGTALAGVAQVAMQQGAYVAKLIHKRLSGDVQPGAPARPFHYFDKGTLAVIGRAAAVGQIGPLRISGLLAWLVWLLIHLMYLVEFSNRILVFIHWGFLYLTFDRGARLITGSDTLPPVANETRPANREDKVYGDEVMPLKK